MIEALAILLAVAAVVWVIAVVFLTAPDHSHFDEPQHDLHRDPSGVSAENDEVIRLINVMQEQLRGGSRRKRILRLRCILDEGFTGSPAEAEQLGVEIMASDANGVAAEWVVAPDANYGRRLLYIHGGAFTVGSPRSHRMITAALSKTCGVAVLAIHYRLMPEHRRKAAIADSQNAYRFMLENGPSGNGTAHEAYVGGDSAGGNLALMLSAWTRDENIRRMNAVIAFSPSTDSTLANPSMIKNIETDPMLGPGLGPPARMPVPLKALGVLIAGQMSPRNPLMSPLFGDLRDLPPTLVQASDCEMLFDDANRYVNKARAQNSPVTLQIWPDMVHVWQMFQHVLPEAGHSIDAVAAFIEANRESASTTEANSG